MRTMSKLICVLLCLLVSFVNICMVSADENEGWYADSASRPVKIKINNITEDKQKELEFTDETGKPVITEAGRTMIPLRKVAESVSAAVAWRDNDKTVHIFKDEKSIMLETKKVSKEGIDDLRTQMQIRNYKLDNNQFAYTSPIEYVPIDKDNPSVITLIDSRTNRVYVPFRAIVEKLGGEVSWTEKDGVMDITININSTSISKMDEYASYWIEQYYYVPSEPEEPGEDNEKPIIVSVYSQEPESVSGIVYHSEAKVTIGDLPALTPIENRASNDTASGTIKESMIDSEQNIQVELDGYSISRIFWKNKNDETVIEETVTEENIQSINIDTQKLKDYILCVEMSKVE